MKISMKGILAILLVLVARTSVNAEPTKAAGLTGAWEIETTGVMVTVTFTDTDIPRLDKDEKRSVGMYIPVELISQQEKLYMAPPFKTINITGSEMLTITPYDGDARIFLFVSLDPLLHVGYRFGYRYYDTVLVCRTVHGDTVDLNLRRIDANTYEIGYTRHSTTLETSKYNYWHGVMRRQGE